LRLFVLYLNFVQWLGPSDNHYLTSAPEGEN
jgi:hypothetical protein